MDKKTTRLKWSGRKQKWIFSLLAFIILLGGIGYYSRNSLMMWGFNTFLSGQIEKKLQSSYEPVREISQTGGQQQTTEDTVKQNVDPFSILLMGTDGRGKERGRSDTLIYTVVRPADNKMLLLSIPRDTYTEIVGKGRKDKITHAYSFGGANMAMETVSKLLDEPVNHYASINFQGFRDVIDAVGGISLPIEKDIVNKDPEHEKFVVKAGKDKYNGTEALNYVRYREDAGGDMNRTGRHQIFLNAILNQAVQVNQWSKLPELMTIMGDNFKTDLPPGTIIDLAKAMLLKNNDRAIYSHTLDGDGHRLEAGGAWYFFADERDVLASKELISKWLDKEIPAASLPLPSEYNNSSSNASSESEEKQAGTGETK